MFVATLVWHQTLCCSHHKTVLLLLLTAYSCADCCSIYSVDLLPSDKFLTSIQAITHPTEAYHNLLMIGWICSLVCHYGVERATVERSCDVTTRKRMIDKLFTIAFLLLTLSSSRDDDMSSPALLVMTWRVMLLSTASRWHWDFSCCEKPAFFRVTSFQFV